MSQKPTNLFERADVFHLFESDNTASSSLSSAAAQENTTVSEEQYAALVRMIASNLGLTSDEAERLFPSYRIAEHTRGSPDGASLTPGGDASATSSASEPPLCAHLVREGVEPYWSDPSANAIPDVRCCDARDWEKQVPFPVTGHGPHVHCLYCFHSAIADALPVGRGVPPPVVPDFRDAASLRTHQQEHHDRYLTYLKLLEDCSSGNFEVAADMLSDEGKAACETAAEMESRHVCYMAAMGTSACPIVVFYCAACDCFAPLVSFQSSYPALADRSHPESDARECRSQDTTSAWTSTEELNVVLSRLLLSCHLLYMVDATRFASGIGSTRGAGSGPTAAAASPRHVLYLFKPILFHDGVQAEQIEEFEDGSDCTYAAVVLPSASVAGEPAELLLLPEDEDAQGDVERRAGSSPLAHSPVVIGFAMEWASEELVQSKLDLVLRQHQLGSRVAGTVISPFHVTMRWVYIEDTEEWVRAHVLFHRTVATRAELPRTYADTAEEGIRVVETYQIDAPIPDTSVTSAAAAVPSSAAIAQDPSNVAAEDEETDPLALDGCPYSMESRTIDFFTRMTALAKAMHELATWRLSIDENKDGLP